MFKRSIKLAALLTMSVTLSACLSGGDGGSGEGDGMGLTGGSAGGGGGSTGGGGSGATFFNDADGVSFANGLGATMSRLFTAGSGGALGGARSSDANSFQGFINRARTNESYDCESGTVTSYTDTDDATGDFTGGGFTYNNCVEDGVTANGSLSFTSSMSADGTSGSITMAFTSFSAEDSGEIAAINGTITIDLAGDDNESRFTIRGPSLSLVDSQGSIEFNNYNMTVIESAVTGSQSLSVDASITDASGTIDMSIDPAFQIAGTDIHPATGVLSMSHSDGSSLMIDADSGNPDTFNYTVNDGSSVFSGEDRWDNTDLMFNDE